MVAREVINKILTDIILKCGYNKVKSNTGSWGVRLPRGVRDSLNNFRRKHCTMGEQSSIEWENAYDHNGNLVYEVSGVEDKVTMDRVELSRLREELGYGLRDIHNHPRGYYNIPVCFSTADLNNFLSTTMDGDDFIFKSCSVATANGSMMTIEKKEGFSKDDIDAYWSACDMLDSIYVEFGRDYNHARTRLAYQMMNGEIDIDMNQDVSVLNKFVNDLAFKEVGGLEDRLANVRRLFNRANVEFSVEWNYH